jgi:hypothetical protein
MTKLLSTCLFRADGVFCRGGCLYYSAHEAPVMVEGEMVECPACEGRGRLLTGAGAELLEFLGTFGKPLLRGLVEELFEERHP